MNNVEGLNMDKISRQPSPSDPDELRIRGELDSLLTTETAKQRIDKVNQIQEEFLVSASAGSIQLDLISKKYLEVISNIAQELDAKLVEGSDYLDNLDAEKGIIIVANHLGIAKLSRVENSGRQIPVDLDEIEPFPSRHAGYKVVADAVGGKLHEAAVELPGVLLDIQEASGVVTIPVSGSGRTKLLVDKVKKIAESDQNSVFIMYPEGGTSGKRNQGGPYDLDEFHKGAFVVASELGIPVVPSVQYLNSEGALEIRILKPIIIEDEDTQDLKVMAERAQVSMQDALDESVR